MTSPLLTSGLIDSFSVAQIGVFVEVTFGVYIPDTDLTVGEHRHPRTGWPGVSSPSGAGAAAESP